MFDNIPIGLSVAADELLLYIASYSISHGNTVILLLEKSVL